MSQTYGDSRTLRSVVTGNYHATFWRPVREGNFPTEFNDSIGLVEIINEYCPKEPEEKISSGHVVKAMILNGLGFVSSPLYLFSEFFKDKPCEHLIGKGVKAEYLNDYKLGRVMDKLFIKGLTEIFLAISMNVKKQFEISSKSSHLDSSSLHVHGEYNTSLPNVVID
ncbi:MAG: DUF4277 domain-containing protein, partial [Cyanobacteria bacterium J06629_18]